MLCADDYGLAEGVSQGIHELAEAQLISATSAIVTFPRWAEDAKRLAVLRPKIAIGLHLMLTLGRPAGLMPDLAPSGLLPSAAGLTAKAVTGRIDAGEIQAEVTRQLELFERHAGFQPDHVDGHQHVHALPGVRQGVLAALAKRFPDQKPLLRDPADRIGAILHRGGERGKALLIAALSAGFRASARRLGFPTNDGFSGFSTFDTARPFEQDLAPALLWTGPRHILMCHPGYPNEELRLIEPIVERRGQELATIRSFPGLADRVWRPKRSGPAAPIDWQKAFGHDR